MEEPPADRDNSQRAFWMHANGDACSRKHLMTDLRLARAVGPVPSSDHRRWGVPGGLSRWAGSATRVGGLPCIPVASAHHRSHACDLRPMPPLPVYIATRYVQPLREGGTLPAVVETHRGGLF